MRPSLSVPGSGVAQTRMRGRPCALLLASALAVAPHAAGAEELHAATAQPVGRLRVFGGQYSVLLGGATGVPLSSETRERYGSWKILPALQLWSFNGSRGAHFAWDLGGRGFSKDGERADFFSATAGVGWQFANGERPAAPYVLLRAGPYLARATPQGYELRFGANAELGVALARRVVLSTRFDRVGGVGGYDLSAMGFAVLVRVL